MRCKTCRRVIKAETNDEFLPVFQYEMMDDSRERNCSNKGNCPECGKIVHLHNPYLRPNNCGDHTLESFYMKRDGKLPWVQDEVKGN